MTRLVRSVYFECLHRYENPKWSEEENRKVFGACFTPHGHGHTYKMEVCVSGPIDPVTGMVINLKELDENIKAVVAKIEGKHLNFEVEEFRHQIPTTENLLHFLFAHLESQFKDRVHLEKVRLYENNDLWVDQFGDPA
jgi:6-pyruvoyltetrahydropterin/6-carboxytetrahydropterin synthase